MKCELCKDHEATVHFKHVVNGDVQEMFICKECAEHGGLNVEGTIPITDFLFGVAAQQQPKTETRIGPTCPVCGMRASDFHEKSRLGCPACYDTFAEDLVPMLQDVQAGPQHRGKVPAREKVHSAIAEMEDHLRQAVEEQKFEEAARLRDHVRNLRQSCGREHADGS